MGGKAHRREREEAHPIVRRPNLNEREELLASLDYIEAHDLLTEDEEVGRSWVEDPAALRAKASARKLPMQERKRALLVLAHHHSEAAFVELMRFLERPDPALVTFAWSALDEASRWYLGERMRPWAGVRAQGAKSS